MGYKSTGNWADDLAHDLTMIGKAVIALFVLMSIAIIVLSILYILK